MSLAGLLTILDDGVGAHRLERRQEPGARLAAGVGLVCLANRGTYSGWTMGPGGSLALSTVSMSASRPDR